MRVAKIDPLGEIAISLLRDAAAEIGPLYTQRGAEQSPAPTNNPLGLRDLCRSSLLASMSTTQPAFAMSCISIAPETGRRRSSNRVVEVETGNHAGRWLI